MAPPLALSHDSLVDDKTNARGDLQVDVKEESKWFPSHAREC